MRQLFKGDNYSREETIRGNTVLRNGYAKYFEKWTLMRQIPPTMYIIFVCQGFPFRRLFIFLLNTELSSLGKKLCPKTFS